MEQNSDKQLNRWLKFMKLGTVFGCHQMPERSFFYKRYQFPICARCTGIFLGQLFGIASYFLHLRPYFLILIALLIPMVLDGLVQLIHIKESNNLRRVLTGLLGGYGYSMLLLYFVVWIIQIVFK